MAIFHHRIQHVSRAKGHSATAASAYRAGICIVCARTGEVFDYSKRQGVAYSTIMAPKRAPIWASISHESLWGAVELFEKKSNARTARENIISLPHELSLEENKAWLFKYVQEAFISKKMIAQIDIHRPDKEGDQRNWHAHILLTPRPCTRKGFSSNKPRNWNSKEMLKEWRELAARHMNRALEKAQAKTRVDHRSFVDQGIQRIPTKKLGAYLSGLERSGETTFRGDYNRKVRAVNKRLGELDRQIILAKKSISIVAEKPLDKIPDFLPPFPEKLRQQIISHESERMRLEAPFSLGRATTKLLIEDQEKEIKKASFWEKISRKNKGRQQQILALKEKLLVIEGREKKAVADFENSFTVPMLFEGLKRHEHDLSPVEVEIYKARQKELEMDFRRSEEDQGRVKVRKEELEKQYGFSKRKALIENLEGQLSKTGLLAVLTGKKKALRKDLETQKSLLSKAQKGLELELGQYQDVLARKRQFEREMRQRQAMIEQSKKHSREPEKNWQQSRRYGDRGDDYELGM